MLVPDPDIGIPAGIRVIVQVPFEGKPLSTTLPVGKIQVGAVMIPTSGGKGVSGRGKIVTLTEGVDTQPFKEVAVKVNVPAGIDVITVEVPFPVDVTNPGLRVTIQSPVAGRPVNATLPVDEKQLVCVMAPGIGADGVLAIVTEVVAITTPHPPVATMVLVTV